MSHSVAFFLSEAGQKWAIKNGKPGMRLQTFLVKAGDVDESLLGRFLNLATIDGNGNASLDTTGGLYGMLAKHFPENERMLYSIQHTAKEYGEIPTLEQLVTDEEERREKALTEARKQIALAKEKYQLEATKHVESLPSSARELVDVVQNSHRLINQGGTNTNGIYHQKFTLNGVVNTDYKDVAIVQESLPRITTLCEEATNLSYQDHAATRLKEQQEREEQHKIHMECLKNFEEWAKVHGSELTKARYEEGYSCWVSSANDDCVAIAAEYLAQLTGLTPADRDEEADDIQDRKCPTLEEIRVLKYVAGKLATNNQHRGLVFHPPTLLYCLYGDDRRTELSVPVTYPDGEKGSIEFVIG